MKNLILTAVFTASVLLCQGTIITVNNNSNSPGQYSDLQEAIDASSSHDTILVTGSSSTYGSATITWPLTLIGAGYNNPYGENSILSNLTLERLNTTLGADDVTIQGFRINIIYMWPSFSGGNITTKKLSDITIERCVLNMVHFGQTSTSFEDITVRNCLFITSSDAFYFSSDQIYSAILVHNNIFDNQEFYANDDNDFSGIAFKNNLFINELDDTFDDDMNFLVVENNIFYSAEPQGCVGCAFNNNLTYLNSNNTIPGPENVGSGNIVDANPQFVNYPTIGDEFSYDYDFHLQPGSPAIGAGTDGSDLGIYGGLLPFENLGDNPTIPQMVDVEIPENASSVELGGTLNVSFEAVKQD